jgi:hypothetical protein
MTFESQFSFLKRCVATGGSSGSDTIIARMAQGSKSKSTGTETACWACAITQDCLGFDATFFGVIKYANDSFSSGFASSTNSDFSPPTIIPTGFFGIQACLSIDVTTYYGEYVILPLNGININTPYNVNLKPYRFATDACSTCLNVVDSNYNVSITYTGI